MNLNKIYAFETNNINQSSKYNNSSQIKEKIREYLKSSTFHGLPNIVRTNSKLFQIIWLIFSIISACTCIFYTFQTISEYLSFNTVTTFKLVSLDQTLFPTVSFCAYPSFNGSIDNIIMATQFENVDATNFSQIFEEFKHKIYGKCFRYNSGKNLYGNKINLVSSTAAGYLNKLKIRIYLHIPEQMDFGELLIRYYLKNIISFKNIISYFNSIHNHSTPPFDIENEGYWVKSGTWNFYQIERVFTEYLDEPYNDCLKNVSRFNLNKTIIDYIFYLNRTYSQTDCHLICSYLHALEESNCSCNSSISNFEKDCIPNYYQSPTSIKSCIAKYLLKFRQNLKSEKCYKYCPLECDSASFQITPFFEPLPTNGIIGNITKTDFGLSRFNTYEQVNKNFFEFFVYYKTLKYTLISQEPQQNIVGIISNIGGIFGLLLGISFLSFIEIFEIIFEIILYKFKNRIV